MSRPGISGSPNVPAYPDLPEASIAITRDRYRDHDGRLHDHEWPDSTGRSGCRGCAIRLNREPVGYSDNLGYLWCVEHAPDDDPRRLPLLPIYAKVYPHNEEPCERCGRILREIDCT